ncbi:hypothetical protein Acr_00g0068280 [Actinidia rufa]|uniref:Uncharacterized protein n=1 Tax=Actinidia rufa TaxID=165716 RepID=A0A7J0DR72_9ERIC|nr:hypothetical protein Acr_00g0068280 [Actinidia rufa]
MRKEKGITSSSSSYTSPETSDSKEEEEKEVVGVESSSSEASLLDKHKGKELAAGPSKKSKKKASGMSSAYLPSSSVDTELWKPEFFIVKLDKQVTAADFAKDYDTNLAVARAVTMPKDVVDLTEEGLEEIRDLLMIQQRSRPNWTLRPVIRPSLSSLLLCERDANNAAVTEAQGEVAAIEEKLDKALGKLGELENIVCGPIFKRVYNRGIDRAVEQPMDPPQVYYPLVLPNLNEEEMLDKADEVPKEAHEMPDELI